MMKTKLSEINPQKMMTTPMDLGMAIHQDLVPVFDYPELTPDAEGYSVTYLDADDNEKRTWISKEEYEELTSPEKLSDGFSSIQNKVERHLSGMEKEWKKKYSDLLDEKDKAQSEVLDEFMKSVGLKPGSIVRFKAGNRYRTGILYSFTYQNGTLMAHYFLLDGFLGTVNTREISDIQELGSVSPDDVANILNDH